MDAMAVLFALVPVIIIFLLLTVLKTTADVAGVAGWLAAMLVACVCFATPLGIALRLTLAGIVASFPISLMVAASLLQITLMMETGAIARVMSVIRTVSPRDQVVQILMINIGVGTVLAAMGATPVSILPPIMLALGYSSFAAIALPAIGYDALCTYALLGIPVVVFAGFVNQPVTEVGGYFARYMPVISTCIAFGMLWIVGKWSMMRKGWLPTVIAGGTAGFIAIGMNAVSLVTITGIAAGLGVILVMALFLKVTGRPVFDASVLTEADKAAKRRLSLRAATSPWLLLVFFALLVNVPALGLFDLTFKKWAMPIEIIPKSPEKVRLFWQSYFWILVSTLLALPFLKPTRAELRTVFAKWAKRAPRPVLATAIFFSIAYLYNHSGKGVDWVLGDPRDNMVSVLALASAGLFGQLYPLIAPFLGLLGGFISGSEASSIAMLTKLHLQTAEKIGATGATGLLIAAASGIGGGLASVISPAKLQNAAASIDRIGEEARVIPMALLISVVITAVCAALTLLWVVL